MGRVKSLMVLASVAFVAGCAGQPAATATAAAPGHESVAAASQSAAPQSTTAAAANDDVTRGYEHEVVKGQDVYCQREAQTGMKVMQKVCMTRAQLVRAQQHTQDMMNNIDRASTNGRPTECRTMGSTAPC